MPSTFREELIDSVDPVGRDAYRQALDAVGEVVGKEGVITEIALRVIKGIERLKFPSGILTNEGLMSPDSQIMDCAAAMVRRKGDGWERYVGKTSPHPTRIHAGYNPHTQIFSLSSAGQLGQQKNFSVTALHPRRKDRITAKFGNDRLEGVLEDGDVTAHLRDCLAGFERDLQSIGLLLCHPEFRRHSDTRTEPDDGRLTLMTDGSQYHFLNDESVDYQNETCPRQMTPDHYRPNFRFRMLEATKLPYIEDVIGSILVHTQGGDVPIDFASLTPRCLTPQRNLDDGAVNAEPKIWLKKHRPVRPWDNVSTMGVNADMHPDFDGAVIRVGDRFTVTSERESWRL